MENLINLVENAKNKDKAAFTSLYELVYKDLYKFALYTLRSQEDAEDVVSDTIIAAYESISKLKEPAAFKGWIFKILTNKCKTKMRQYYNQTTELNECSNTYSPDYSGQHDIRQAFKHLDDEERLIVSLSLFGGYKGKEISKFLSINHNTIRSKYKRALEKMKKYIEMEEKVQ